jgi:hypothetical protein
MIKWELVIVSCSAAVFVIKLEPAGKINLQTIVQKHPKVKVKPDKDSDADTLDFGSHAEAKRAYHSLLEWLCSEGWEPFAVSAGMVYLKRQI